jgi:MYXO-CTERM domain-containing protein
VAVGQCDPVDVLHCTAYTDTTDGTACTCGSQHGTCVVGTCSCVPIPDGGLDAADAAPDGPDATPADAAQTDAAHADAAPTTDALAEDAAATLDAGLPDAGGSDATVCPTQPVVKSSSCGCAAATGAPGAVLALLGLLAFLLRRGRGRRPGR